MNFLIAPQKVYRLVKQNSKKPPTTTVCRCGGKNHSFAIICKWCNQVVPCEPPSLDPALFPKQGLNLSDEAIAQLDDMYKGYAEP